MMSFISCSKSAEAPVEPCCESHASMSVADDSQNVFFPDYGCEAYFNCKVCNQYVCTKHNCFVPGDLKEPLRCVCGYVPECLHDISQHNLTCDGLPEMMSSDPSIRLCIRCGKPEGDVNPHPDCKFPDKQ